MYVEDVVLLLVLVLLCENRWDVLTGGVDDQ